MGTRCAALAVAACAAAVCFLGLPPTAAAQTQPAADDAGHEQARELFSRGRQLYQQDRPEEALELLRQSYELFPSWATSNGMALCEEKLGHPQQALELYERSVLEGGTVIPGVQRTQLEQHIQDLRRSLDLAHLSITTAPAGAEVSFDGVPLGTTPYEGDVAAGARTLGITLEGYEAAGRSISLAAGEARSLEVTLVVRAETSPVSPPSAVSPPGGERGLLVVTAAGAGHPVYVDGTQVGVTPLAPMEVAVGERSIRVEAGDRAWEERLQVGPQQTVRVNLTFGQGVEQGWFWGIAATAAAAGIGCAATGGYALSLYDEYQGASAARRNEIVPTGDMMLDVTDALLGVAGAAAVTALVLAFFTDFGGEPEASITFAGAEEGAGDATATSRALVW